MELSDYPAQSIHAGQQRLAAVQHDLDRTQVVPGRVLDDPLRRSPQHVVRHGLGLPTPALIGCLVDVAVIASEVAPAVDLEDELIQRQERRFHAGL